MEVKCNFPKRFRLFLGLLAAIYCKFNEQAFFRFAIMLLTYMTPWQGNHETIYSGVIQLANYFAVLCQTYSDNFIKRYSANFHNLNIKLSSRDSEHRKVDPGTKMLNTTPSEYFSLFLVSNPACLKNLMKKRETFFRNVSNRHGQHIWKNAALSFFCQILIHTSHPDLGENWSIFGRKCWKITNTSKTVQYG